MKQESRIMEKNKMGRKMGSIFALLFLITLVATPFLSSPAYATTLSWTTASLSQARENLAATSVGNKAIFAGGRFQACCSTGSPYSDVVDIYDSVTNQWTVSTLSRARSNMGATSVGDLAIFAGGAGWSGTTGVVPTSEVDIYNASTGTWTIANLSNPRSELAATTVGNKAMFAGGSGSDRVDVYDHSSGVWSTTSFSQPRWRLAATSVCGKAFFAGGITLGPGNPTSAVVDIYDEDTDSWSTANLSEARSLLVATTAENKAIFAGGLNSSEVRSAVVDIYDCDTDTWSVSSLSVARHYLAATTLGGNALFGGGFRSSFSPNFTNAVDIYNGVGWNTSSLSISRMQLAATTAGNKAIFAGGVGSAFSNKSNRVDIATLIPNLIPNANAGPDKTVNEGSTVTLDGSGSTDPDGNEDIVSYDWDFGDGFTGSGSTVNHTYQDNGVYIATLTITDTQNESDTDIAIITVNNVMPIVNAGAGVTINEGGQFIRSGSFTDPGTLDTHTATVNYGDGTGTLPLTLSGNNFNLNHTYQDDGIYTVTVRVTDSDTGLGIDTVAVTVNNLAPSIGSISSVNPVLPGVQINVSSSFSDAGVLDSHTATWDWGDSNSSTGVVSETNGSGIVTGSHTYSSPGVYTATLTVDDGTDSNSQTFSVIILTPSEAINNLVDLVETFNLQQGINNSLDAKLDAALNALDDVNENNDQAAINSLYAFINSVEAQRGNQITNSQADQLVAAAQAIIVYLSS